MKRCGHIGLLVLIALLVETGCGSKDKPGTAPSVPPTGGVIAPPGNPPPGNPPPGNPLPRGTPGNTAPDPQPRKTPDFNKFDYSVDFSKVNYSPVDWSKLDYSKGPERQVIQERLGTHPSEQGSLESGKVYSERGYMGQKGEFVRHGAMMTWHDANRTKKFRGAQYYKGEKHGPFVAWDNEGNKELEGVSVNGKRHGLLTAFYPSGQKKGDSYYLAGEEHGKRREWHDNGSRKSETIMKNGREHGKMLKWHPNGSSFSEMWYFDGKQHGPLTSWYPNGQKQVESVFVDGKEEARRLEWHANGQKSLEVVRTDGLAQGKQTEWHENGKKRREGPMKDGVEQGSWSYWKPDGSLERQTRFFDGFPAESEDVAQFVNKFAKINRKATWKWHFTPGVNAAHMFERPKSKAQGEFVLHQIAGGEGRAESVFTAVGKPDKVLSTSKGTWDQEWVFYRGDTVIRCLVFNRTALQERRKSAEAFPGDEVIIAAPGLLVGGGKDF